MRKRGFMLLIDVFITVLLLAVDQFTKYLAIKYLKDAPSVVLIDGVLELSYLENRGSAFGMLQNQKFFILFVGFVFLAVILFFLFKLPEDKKYTVVHICLAAIIAGGIGNMIDRFRFDFVVDFIYFEWINFPVFNVADCYVCISAVLLVYCLIFKYKDDDFIWKKS